jgi:hypothetical protein
MTLSRIHALESMGFEWKPSTRRWKEHQRNQAPRRYFLTCVRKRAVELQRLHGQDKEPNHFPTPSSWLQTPRKMTDCLEAGELTRCIPLETAQSNEMPRAYPVVAELPAVQRQNVLSPRLLIEMGHHQESCSSHSRRSGKRPTR